MRNGFAESLGQFLAESAYNLAMFEERRVVVVGIVGKGTGDTSKADLINSLLQRPVFIQQIAPEGATASVQFWLFDYKMRSFMIL